MAFVLTASGSGPHMASMMKVYLSSFPGFTVWDLGTAQLTWKQNRSLGKITPTKKSLLLRAWMPVPVLERNRLGVKLVPDHSAWRLHKHRAGLQALGSGGFVIIFVK